MEQWLPGAEEIEKWEALVNFHRILATQDEKALEEYLQVIKFHILEHC